MEIVRLTKENEIQYGYGCMTKGNIYVLHPQPYRDSLLPSLENHLGKDVFGFVAVDGDKSVGHLLIGTVWALGVPMRVHPDNSETSPE